jgi:hypothetical protein
MFIEAVVGFEWVAIIAVSSANVLRRVVEVCGISAVYNVYRMGPRILVRDGVVSTLDLLGTTG